MGNIVVPPGVGRPRRGIGARIVRQREFGESFCYSKRRSKVETRQEVSILPFGQAKPSLKNF